MLVLLCLCSSGLVLTGGCHKDTTPSPIPSFCAAEPDWGPNGVIVFANQPWQVIPPETSIPADSVGLWTIKTDGSELRFLVGSTPDSRDFYGHPEWSPDGKWIVANDFITRIWLVSADGDSLIMITEQGGKSFPSFRPDGKRIAFSTPGPDGGLRILDLDMGLERFVFHGTEPSWSPDGGKLVFSGSLQQGRGVVVADTTGENPSLVYGLEGSEWLESPSFAPDGSRIAFGVSLGGIWVVNADGSRPKRLTKKLGRWPSWSPDGSKIVFTRVTEFVAGPGWSDWSLPPSQEGIGDLYIINTDGSGERRLTFFYPR
jgi:Tol biopolymer transport system component